MLSGLQGHTQRFRGSGAKPNDAHLVWPGKDGTEIGRKRKEGEKEKGEGGRVREGKREGEREKGDGERERGREGKTE